ncbi:MAG: hypothetical protein GXO76_09450 [Calditrichaeota bacterium]|nr:hypothetical protein [Calditrichota bacterium]
MSAFFENKTFVKRVLVSGALVWLLGWLMLGCAERKHANPLDPLNPVTKGKPTGLRVLSDHHKVFLTWPMPALNSLTGIHIYRGTDSTAVEKIASVPLQKKTFVDSHTVYKTTYYYSYSLVADGYESPRSEPQAITPGPSFFWVSFNSTGQLFKLTFDIEHTYKGVTTGGFPAAIALAGQGRGVWVADDYLGEVYRISDSGQTLFSIRGFGRISSIACDTTGSLLWVADLRNKRVVVVDTLGYGKFAITGFEYPCQVMVNQSTGDCWIVDSKQKTLVRSDRSGKELRTVQSLAAPKWVSLVETDGSVWVADSSRVVRVLKDGEIKNRIDGFSYAYRVAVDSKRNAVFVFDQSYGWLGTELVKLSPNGTRQFSLRGFGFPKHMVVDPFDGSCVVADTYNSRVVKVSPEGKIRQEKRYQSAPGWIAIEK